jgi:hypothetical protein
MNLLFPVSITLSTIVAAMLGQAAIAPGVDEFQAAGLTILATLMALAILEHWFMVLPLPTAGLWRWGLRSREAGGPQRGGGIPGCRHDEIVLVPRER